MSLLSRTLLGLVLFPFASQAAPFTIHGHVLPAKARIALHAVEPSFMEGSHWLAGQTQGLAAAQTVSDAEGFFELIVPDAGMWTVVAAAPGRVPMEYPLLPLVEDRQLPSVDLPRDEEFLLRVDSQGQAMAGARVEVQPRVPSERQGNGAEPASWRPARRRAVTDDQGEARLPRQPGERLRLVVLPGKGTPGGLLPAETETYKAEAIVTLRPGEARTLLLRSGVMPLKGALVRLGNTGWCVASSDDDGRVELVLAPGRQATLLVELADRYRPASPLRLVEGNAPTEILVPGPTARRGRVVDAVGGQLVGNAVVWPLGRPDLFVRTDTAGAYVIEGLHLSDRWLHVAASAYFPEVFEHVRTASASDAPIVALTPSASLVGRVVDASGQPLSGVELRARYTEGPRRSGIRENDGLESFSRSIGDGSFRLAGLLPRATYTLEATHEGFAPTRRVTGPMSRGPDSLEALVLRRGFTAYGAVFDTRDAPLAGATVTLGIASFAAPFATLTDTEGRFGISRLPAGIVTLDVARQGFAPFRVTGLSLGRLASGEELPDGSTIDLGTLVLAPGVRLEGHVRDPSGKALANAEIRLARQPVPPWLARAAARSADRELPAPEAISAANGIFFLEDLRPGERLSLDVRRAGYAPALVGGVEAGAAPAEPLTVVLDPEARVAGQVVDASGEPLVRVGVALLAQGLGPSTPGGGGRLAAETLTDRDGRFDLVTAPGALTLIASGLGYQRAVLHDLEVAPGATLDDLSVTLHRGADLTGTVRRPDGSPARGAAVRVLRRGVGDQLVPTYYGTRADGEGRYRLGGIPTGRQLLGAEIDGFPCTVRSVDLGPGAAVVDFELTAGAAIHGRVIDAAGQPIAGADLYLAGPDPRAPAIARTRSSAEGAFAFEGVPVGTYRIVASREGYAPVTSESVSTQDGTVEDVELAMAGGTVLLGQVHGLDPADFPEVTVRALTRRAGRHGAVAYDGTYRVEDLGPGDWVVQGRLSDGRQAQTDITVEEGAPEVRADLEFGTGLVLTGRATRSDVPEASPHTAVAGARVILSGLDVLRGGVAATSRDGSFRLDGLAPGRYRLTLEDPGGGILHSEELDLEQDDHLELEIATSRLAGQVIDARDSSPLREVRLVARSSEGSPPQTAESDSQGRFRLRGLAAGTWQVRAEKAGFQTSDLEVRVGHEPREDLEIELAPAPGLTLRVATASGASPAQVYVAAFNPAGEQVTGGTYPVSHEGTVESTGLGEGRWRLLVGSDGSATETVWVEVPGPPVDVRLRAGGTLEIEVPELAGSETIAQVRLVGGHGQELVRVERGGRTRRDWSVVLGKATVEGVPGGTWQARVVSSDQRFWSGTSDLAEGGTQVLTLGRGG